MLYLEVRFVKFLRFLLLIALLAVPFSLSSVATSQRPPGVAERNIPAVGAFALATSQVDAAESLAVAIEGWVKTDLDNEPVTGATVVLGDLSTVANIDGYFSFSESDVAGAGISMSEAAVSIPVTAAVYAEGYAPWTLRNAVYYAGDTLRLYPRLSPEGEQPVNIEAEQRRASTRTPESLTHSIFEPQTEPGVSALSSASMSAALTPPATIRVYRTAKGVVEVVPFRDYIKRTLPNEWIPSWSSESLKAGAMAVKSYAWFWVSRGGKQTALGADVKDNVDDQVYDPNVSYASTDAAVDATFNASLTRNGALFQTQYCAGSYDPDPTGECPWPGNYLTQWGSSYHADQGKSWIWILEFYYAGAVVAPSAGGSTRDAAPVPTRVPPTATTIAFAVGQGSPRTDVFLDAYNRNGGQQLLGRPTGAVRWWLPALSEQNILAQPFSGSRGEGNLWIVYDILKSSDAAGHRAFLLSGEIAKAYKNHVPSGPEWVGAPTSDLYVASAEMGGSSSQGFSRGTLTVTRGNVEFRPWPEIFVGWKAEYFVGKRAAITSMGPPPDIAGRPALVLDLPSPDMSWSPETSTAQAHGVGSGSWTGQFTRNFQVEKGSYDFVIEAEGGIRLWVDNLLAINAWDARVPQTVSYNAALEAGEHRFRIQYASDGPAARLKFAFAPRKAEVNAPAAERPSGGSGATGVTALRVRVQWLGRGPAPGDSWVRPLQLSLSDPATSKIILTVQGTTDRNGVAHFGSLPVGIYNVHVKGPHSLQSARSNIALRPGATAEVDMKTQVEGDVDGDNCVNIQDLSTVQAKLGTYRSVAGYSSGADLNGDGLVSMDDISLLRSGFDTCGDISADNQFSVLSTSAAPNLGQVLAPWTHPENLQRNLSIELSRLEGNTKVGSITEVQVVAQTGRQAIDGVTFVVNYDPRRLQAVDTAGNPARGIEPGLALPAVMGNWIDHAGGAIGYSAGIVQGQPPYGRVVLAKLRFRVLSGAIGPAVLQFRAAPSEQMQLTNGGVNLLASARGVELPVAP